MNTWKIVPPPSLLTTRGARPLRFQTPTSVLMSDILKRFGDVGWMDITERAAAQHLRPLKKAAKKTIRAHRFEIRSLNRFPGVMPKNSREAKHIRSFVGSQYRLNFTEKGYETKRRCVETHGPLRLQNTVYMTADI